MQPPLPSGLSQSARYQTLDQLPLPQVIEKILLTGKITTADADRLLRAGKGLEPPLSPEDDKRVSLIFTRLQMGLLRIEH